MPASNCVQHSRSLAMIQLGSFRLMHVSQCLDGFGRRYRIVAASNADVRSCVRRWAMMFTMTTRLCIGRVARPRLVTLDE
jgi:hypothetical protein